MDKNPTSPETTEVDENALMRAERLLKNSQNAIKNLSAELSSKDDQLSENIKKVRRQAKVIGVLRDELNVARNDIENLRASTSWKITSPIRIIGTMLKAPFRKS